MHAQAATNLATDPRQLLRAALAAGAQPYEPRFTVTEADGGYWVRDHDLPIAWIHGQRYTLDAFEFSPFTSLGRDLALHPRYDMGTYINMHATLLHPSAGGLFGINHGTVSAPHWQTDDPQSIRLRLTGDYDGDVHVEGELTIAYDPETGQYLYRLHKQVRRPDPIAHEFCNVYPRELGNGIPAQKKWQHTVWLDPHGRLRRFAQNPALTLQMDPGGARLGRKAIASDGFIGWGTEPDMNLLVLFEHTDAPLVSGTCDQWYDEHLRFDEAGLAARGGEASATFRLLHAPAEAMRTLIERAEPVVIDDDEIAERGGPAFVPGQVNDLETVMDPNTPQTGQVWRVTSAAGGKMSVTDPDGRDAGMVPVAEHVAWVDDCAHSGQRSIRINGVADRVLWLTPMGPNFRTADHTRYRFEAWIRTRGARAWLWMGRIWHNWTTAHGAGESAVIEGDTDWTHVYVELDSDDLPYMLCRLCVEGEGDAWFDDLRFVEVGPSASAHD